MAGFWLNLASLVLLLAVATCNEFVTQLRKCRVDSKVELNNCLRSALEDLRPYFRTGIPQLGLEPLEPMHIPNIAFRQGEGSVILEATFRDVQVSGLSNFTTNFVDADRAQERLTVGLHVPSLFIKGLYSINGKLLILPIQGSGTFTGIFTGIDATGVSRLSVVRTAGNNERLQASGTNIDFTVRDLSINLDNLFDGDAILQKTMDLFLKDNAQIILQDIKPEVSRQLNELVEKIVNDSLSQLPLSTFLITK